MNSYQAEINKTEFLLKLYVNVSLKQKYVVGKPLTFPINNCQISRFTRTPNLINNFNTVLCQAINNCDMLFL